MHAETESTPSHAESLLPNVKILSEELQEVQQKLTENLCVAVTSELREIQTFVSALAHFPVVAGAPLQRVHVLKRTPLTGFSPVLMYGERGASEADSGIGSGRGGGVGGGTRE